MEYTEIINFWFNEIDTSLWFKKNEEFDQLLRDRFSAVHRSAAQGELNTTRKRWMAETINRSCADQ